MKQKTGLHKSTLVPHVVGVHSVHSGVLVGGCVHVPFATRHRSSVHAFPSRHFAACSAAVKGTKPHTPLAQSGFSHSLVELAHTVYDGTQDPVVGLDALLVQV